MDQHTNGHSWGNALKGLVLGALVGSLVGLSASLSLLLISGSSLSLALGTLAVFTGVIAGIGGFIGVLIDQDQRERTQDR
jgi:hypothetical protein